MVHQCSAREKEHSWITLTVRRERCTHSWMVPPQSLLPDGQSIVQQVGCLLIFVLIPDRQKQTESDRNTQTQTDRIADKHTKKKKT